MVIDVPSVWFPDIKSRCDKADVLPMSSVTACHKIQACEKGNTFFSGKQGHHGANAILIYRHYTLHNPHFLLPIFAIYLTEEMVLFVIITSHFAAFYGNVFSLILNTCNKATFLTIAPPSLKIFIQ